MLKIKDIGSVISSVGQAIASFTVAQAIDKLTASVLTYTYCSNATGFYQAEVWDLYQSFLKGMSKPMTEEDEVEIDL